MKKYYYIQSWGTYPRDTIIFVSHDRKNMFSVLNKYHRAKVFIDEINKCESKDLFETNQGFMVVSGTKTLIAINEWGNQYQHQDVLLHEINHAVHAVFTTTGMIQEYEAFAYQQEFLFKQIRTRLNKVYGFNDIKSIKRKS